MSLVEVKCDHGDVTVGSSALDALRDESAALIAALEGLSGPAWQRPTRCAPWLVRDLVGHIITALARVPDMVAAPAPERAEITAADYFRADDRFSEAVNADRVRTGRERAGSADPAMLVQELTNTWQAVVAVSERQPEGRVVLTRHGDAMLLTEFLITRVFEVAVHGIDIADAVDVEPWLTPAATGHLLRMLFGPTGSTALDATGWDAPTLVRKATGRAPISPIESAMLDQLGMRRLALG
jgi:uncharacterized protein (TIGR03083 family)